MVAEITKLVAGNVDHGNFKRWYPLGNP